LFPLPNVGSQLLDVVTVVDARAKVSGAVYRVQGIVGPQDTRKRPLLRE